MRQWMCVVLMLACCLRAGGMEWRDSPEVAAVFAAAGVKGGTFVLYDVAEDVFVGYNRERAETRYIPASTFKITNTLIGLASGAVSGVDEVLPYGGGPQPTQEWARDMSLREAIVVSNVPIYQELARRIGLARMGEYLGRLDYGNAETGAVVDRFWLDGPLAISAAEQACFLARLAKDELPLPIWVQAATRDIARLEQGEGWELFGKTGSALKPTPAIGWWVGWIRRGDRIYTFALNIDMAGADEFGKRVEVGRACLKALGLL